LSAVLSGIAGLTAWVNAECLLPGGRGALLAANVTMQPRVRWVKDPVGLNRRSGGGALWVLNSSA
jgi:hypothetical protein